MSRYIKFFETAAELEAAKASMPYPCVAWSPESDEPYYKPYIVGVIDFEDTTVKTILLNSGLVDTIGDNEITVQEAAAVTNLYTGSTLAADSIFTGNTTITSFGELRYFTGLTRIDKFFYGCTNLTTAAISLDNDTAMSFRMLFSDCSKLTSASILSGKANNIEKAFYKCNILESLDLSGIDVSTCTTFANAFNQCKKLKTLDLSGWSVSNSATSTQMFTQCSVLATVVMDGCSSTSIEAIEGFLAATAPTVSTLSIVDNIGTGTGVSGAGTYTYSDGTWNFTPQS